MTPLTVLREAQADMRRAAHYYEAEAPGLGMEFIVEVNRAFTRLSEYPQIGVSSRRGTRKLLVRRFPYLIIYRVEATGVLVLAVEHQRRHPNFWLERA